MSDFNRGFGRTVSPQSPQGSVADMGVDTGLRSFMLGVYNKMALGLVLSGVLAWLTSSYPPVRDALYVVTPDGRLAGFTLAGTLIRFAPIVMIFGSMFMMRNPTARSSGILYWALVSTIGAGLGVWLLAYTGMSVATTFFIAASAFGALSLVGYTTKRDLSGMGSFLIMGLFGIIIASLVNLFIASSAFQFGISVLAILIFAGLTAWDTQMIKEMYDPRDGVEEATKK